MILIEQYHMEEEYRTKVELPSLYELLGLTQDVCHEENCDEIVKKAYVKSIKNCHPGLHHKNPDLAANFELLTGAYEILCKHETRKEYNKKILLEKQSRHDYSSLKKGYVESVGEHTEYIAPSDEMKLAFKESMSKMDAKHGYDCNSISSMNEEETIKRVEDLRNARRTEYDQYVPDNLFPTAFDASKFNAAFDLIHKRNQDAMINYAGNPVATSNSLMNYSNISDMNRLYSDGDGIASSFTVNNTKLSKEEIDKLVNASYYKDHNVIGEDYYTDIKARLREREADGKKLSTQDYSSYKDIGTGGYGLLEDDPHAKKWTKMIANNEDESDSDSDSDLDVTAI